MNNFDSCGSWLRAGPIVFCCLDLGFSQTRPLLPFGALHRSPFGGPAVHGTSGESLFVTPFLVVVYPCPRPVWDVFRGDLVVG